MGKSRQELQKPRERMIDLSTKQPVVGDRELRVPKKACRVSRTQTRRKHDAINLPRNVGIGSDSEEYQSDALSDDGNDEFTQEPFAANDTSHELGADKLSCTLKNLALSDKESTVNEVLRKLSTLVSDYKSTLPQAHYEDKELKARSPFRNQLTKPRQTPFDRPDLTVTTAHGNGARVLVHNCVPSSIPEPVATFPRENLLLDAIQDKAFLDSWKGLTTDQAEQILLQFIGQEETPVPNRYLIPADAYVQRNPSPDRTMLQRTMSPDSVDLYDSCYETGSPGSTVVTSPGSPAQRMCHTRTSFSSESDQELDFVVEHRPLTNRVNVVVVTSPPESEGLIVRPEPMMKPLGEAVHCVTTSASQRLYELSKSTSFCIKHFTIQLVRVVMTTKTDVNSDKIDSFCKSLLSTMKTKLINKAHEGDIWQLSIYAHIQFMTAPDRVQEYQLALLSRDELGHSLLYIAAVERFEKPLIARYVAESMAQAGYNPQEEVDKQGDTIIHIVAQQGDSHIQVLSELLMACSAKQEPLFSVRKLNHSGQSALHVAAQTPNSHLNTMLLLLNKGAHPLKQDKHQMSPLHYHVRRMSLGIRRGEDVGVVRKMLHSPIPMRAESLQMLEELSAQSYVPPDVRAFILDFIYTHPKKELKMKKK